MAQHRTRYADLHEAIKATILVALYRKQGFMAMDIHHLRQKATALSPDFVDDRDVSLALQSLFDESYVDMSAGSFDFAPPAGTGRGARSGRFISGEYSPIDATGIVITETGQEYVSRQSKAKSYLGDFLRGDDDHADEVIEDLYAELQDLEPIRYRDPRQVIDLGGAPKAMEAMVQHLGDLIRMVETNNQLMAARSAAVDQAVVDLKSGLSVIRTSRFAVGKLEGLLYGSLAYLATQFADEPIGHAAHMVWNLVKSSIQHWLL